MEKVKSVWKKFKAFIIAFLIIVASIIGVIVVFPPTPSTGVITHKFGYETMGGSTASIENVIRGSVFTCPEAGNATSITAYISSSADYYGYAKAAIYWHSNLSLVGSTPAVYVGETGAWYTFTFDTQPDLVNTDYILVVWAQSLTGTCYLKYDVGDTNQEHYQSATYGNFPNPLVPTHNNYKYSIYCTYETEDITAPTYSNVGTNTTRAGESCKFSVLWNDNVNMSGFIFGTDNTGIWINETWIAFSTFYNSTAAWSNVTKTLNYTAIQWRVWANDTSNNWNNIPTQSLIATPSLIGTTSSAFAIDNPNQRKNFFANTRFWCFYLNVTAGYVVYRTSTDRFTWSGTTQMSIIQCLYGDSYSLWFDGTFMYYTIAYYSSIYYRRGTPNSNGTITWSASQQTVSTTYNSAFMPSVIVDSAGYTWIGYEDYTGSYWYPYVIKSGNNDGTWGTTPSGFPYQLSTSPSAQSVWAVTMIPLTVQKVFSIYALPTTTIKIKSWNGSTWNAEKATASAISEMSGIFHSAVAEIDDVHLVFQKYNTYDIIYVRYNYTINAVGTETIIEASTTTWTAPSLSRNPNNNVLYCFWIGTPTAYHIYYSEFISGTWELHVDWIDESTEKFTYNYRLASFYNVYENYIGLIYLTMLGSPYNVRFALLIFTSTDLNVGWNNFTVLSIDVGKTLRQVNASLNFDTINWTIISLEYANGTRYVFVYGYSYNANIQVASVDNTFYIYCNVEAIWTHIYP